MGWWNGSNDDSNENKRFNSSSTFKSSTTTRQCRPDPNDQNFLICKNIVKETSTVNGQRSEETKEFEERVQVQPQRMQQFNQNFPENDFFEEEFGKMFENMAQNFFTNFPTMFIGPLKVESQLNPAAQRQPTQPQKARKNDIYDC